MAKVLCPCCGEEYEDTLTNCPLCGVENAHLPTLTVDSVENKENSSITVSCACCGEVYDIGMRTCPICGIENPNFVQKDVSLTNNATLLDEESDFVPPKKKAAPVKQEGPSANMVLGCFIGIIVIMVILFINLISGVTKNETSKIGTSTFGQQEQHEYRGLQYE